MSDVHDPNDGSTLPRRGERGAGNVAASATSSGAVTKSDSTALQFRAIYVGGAGDVGGAGGNILNITGASPYVVLPRDWVYPGSPMRRMPTSPASKSSWLPSMASKSPARAS